LIGSIYFLDVRNSERDFTYKVTNAVEKARKNVWLADEISFHSTKTRTTVVVVKITIITSLRGKADVISTDRRHSQTLASCWNKKEQVSSVTY